jgi:hypothetical protein
MQNTVWLTEQEVITILNEHYKKQGFAVRKVKRPDSFHDFLEIVTEPLKDFTFHYQLEKLETTDHLLEKVVKMPTQKRNNVFDFSSLNSDEAKAIIKNYILARLSEQERMIMIEIYELCPQTVCKGAPKSLAGKKIARSVQNLYKLFPRTEADKMVSVHRRIINDLRNALHEFQKN